MTSELQLFLLGKPRLLWEGQPFTGLVSVKAQALLFYLAVTGQPCSRSALAGLLWGDMPEESARANLRLTLSKLRKAIPDHLIIEWNSVAFDLTRPHRLDVNEFIVHGLQPTQRLADAERVRAAVTLYRGDFLEDFAVRDAPEFENWVLAERERLRQAALRAWQYLAALAVERGDEVEGIETARQVLALEPWREEAHQQLMTLLAANGQRGAALAQYEICRRVLADELAIEPSAATMALYQQIARDTVKPKGAPHPIRLPAPAVRPAFAHNLPAQLTPFIGREAERAQMADRLANPECRLLTILGPGGIGKTRLALALAETQIELFREGVVFVPLVGVTPALPDEAVEALVAAVANALQYTFVAQQQPSDVLVNYLTDKELLLILDNVETLRSASRWLTEVLRRAPGVKVLATSRERLGVMGEWLFELRGLPFAPTLTEYASPAYPAVQLFAQCARRLRPAFDLSTESAAVNRLCQLVEGSPLGIELAAQLTPVLSCPEIVARLEHSFDVLSVTSAQAGERHQSMRAVLADSWRALSEEERRAFRHLSVFQGGFTLAAAEKVAGATLPLLAGLTDKSWLQRAGEDRYRIHELLRQFGAEQLAAQPSESQITQEVHGRYYLAFLRDRWQAFENWANLRALAEADQEVDNLRAARDWWLAQPDTSALADYLEGLWRYYRRKGWWQEVVLALDQAVQVSAATNIQRGVWRRWLGEANYQMGRVAVSEEHLLEGLTLLKEPPPRDANGWGLKLLGQAARQCLHRLWTSAFIGREAFESQRLLNAAEALNHLGPISYQAGEGPQTLTVALWSLNLAERAGSTADMARACAGCGITLGSLPIHSLAQAYSVRAITLARSTHDPLVQAYTLELAGLYGLGIGRWAEAEAMLAEAADLYQRLELSRGEIEARALVGKLLGFQGMFSAAHECVSTNLSISRGHADPTGEYWSLTSLAEFALWSGEPPLTDVINWLTRAQALLSQHSFGLADVMRGYALLALAHQRAGDEPQAHAYVQIALRWLKRRKLAGVWALDGFAALAEACLQLNISASPALQGLQAFAQIFPIAGPRAWFWEGKQAWQTGQSARAQSAWRKSQNLAEQLAMPYEQRLAREELEPQSQ